MRKSFQNFHYFTHKLKPHQILNLISVKIINISYNSQSIPTVILYIINIKNTTVGFMSDLQVVYKN